MSCSSVNLKLGILAPTLTCCGSCSHRRKFSGVLFTIPAPSCLRLAECVRAGPKVAEAIVPLMVWQFTQLIFSKRARPFCAFSLQGGGAGRICVFCHFCNHSYGSATSKKCIQAC